MNRKDKELVTKCAEAMGMETSKESAEFARFRKDVESGRGGEYFRRLYYTDEIELVCRFAELIDYEVPKHPLADELEERLGMSVEDYLEMNDEMIDSAYGAYIGILMTVDDILEVSGVDAAYDTLSDMRMLVQINKLANLFIND